VYNPVAEIVPAVHDHTTAGLLAFCTLALNCTVPDDGTLGPSGATATLTAGAAACTVTLAAADFVVSATLVAVMVTVELVVICGAWKTPVLEMLPALADQVTCWSLAFFTVAENV
jgi:hypothetical protein